MLNSCFPSVDVEQIGSVIISPLGQADKMIWRGTPSGLFTVKSAYHMEMQRLSQERVRVWASLEVEMFGRLFGI